MCKKYKDRDITFYYQDGDPKQIARLQKYVEVKKYNGEKIKCDRAFFNYHYDIIDNVEAKEYIQVLHTDYSMQDVTFVRCPKITRYLAPTKPVAKNFTKLTGLPCDVCANPISIDKPKRLLKLVSATRLSKEKRF